MPQDSQPTGANYSNIPQGGLPQYTEAWALIEAARRMAVATTAEDSKIAMRDALRLNWRLWTIFQTELTVGESDVPEDLRLDMLTLCKFIDQHTVNAIHKPTTEKIEVLVNINRNIAGGLLDGLNKTVEDAEKERQAQAQAQAPEPANESQAPPEEPAVEPLTSFDETI